MCSTDTITRILPLIVYIWCGLIGTNGFIGQNVGVGAWTTDILPKLYIKYDQEKRYMFFGNQTDYFQLLDADDNSLLIGARNALYNISIPNLVENLPQRLEWSSSVAHRELCALKGKQDVDCQNYVRVYARVDRNKIMVCGTNSYKPLCRYYKERGADEPKALEIIKNDDAEAENIDEQKDEAVISIEVAEEIKDENNLTFSDNENASSSYEMVEESDGQGRCPYNPLHNSSFVYTDGQLYSATVADFSGGDALIYRGIQRTEQFNPKQLNQPSFVRTVERNGYVFFFFREIALENTNCGKAIYSRVGRVCKNDRGGPSHFNQRWTSYLKTRLNCSIPGDFPFYFDEIQGASKIIDGLYAAAKRQQQRNLNGDYSSEDQSSDTTLNSMQFKQASVIYAVFTTPQNAIPGSAVCMFSIDDIIKTFEGDFKSQKDATSNWLPIPKEEVPEPRPGRCVDDSRELPIRTVNFVKMHTLMESAVPAMYGKPILTRVSSKHRFTTIAVDPQIEALDGRFYDVIFVGTDNGRVVKLINFVRPTMGNKTNANESKDKTSDLETIVITETQALPHGFPVKDLSIARSQQSLVAVGNGHIVSIPLNHCSHILRCRSCLNLQDPYCVWDVKNHECTSILNIPSSNRQNYIQNLLQARRDSSSTIELCKKSGDDTDNFIDPIPQSILGSKTKSSTPNSADNSINGNSNVAAQPHLASTRGTVTSIGRVAPLLPNAEGDNSQQNNIRVTSIDGAESTNQINTNFDAFFNSANGIDLDESGELGIVVPRNLGSQPVAAANNIGNHSTIMAHPMFVSVIFIVFAVGLAIGFILSKRFKFSHSPFDILRGNGSGSSSGHHHLNEHHRNQLNWYDKTTRGIPAGAPLNSSGVGTGSKDINLLMNVMGPFIAAGGGNGRTSLPNAVNTGCTTPNNLNKKDILEIEFETKDRSHECKNSTEHLDINDLKSTALHTNNNSNSNNNSNNNNNNNSNNNNSNNNSSINNNNSNTPTAVIVNTTNTGTLQKVKKTYL